MKNRELIERIAEFLILEYAKTSDHHYHDAWLKLSRL